MFLLTGLTGSGKTTFAHSLETRGVVRLSPHEFVHVRFGRYGVDYLEDRYFELEAPILEQVRARLAVLVEQGRDVVLDHGLWRRPERDAYKTLVEAHGGRWRLLYFRVGKEELLRRLADRNQRTDANALTVTPQALDDFYGRFDEPDGEGEEVITSLEGCRLSATTGRNDRSDGRTRTAHAVG